MPDGYLSAACWIVTVILWWSGWRKEMTDRLPIPLVTLFLAAWPWSYCGSLSASLFGRTVLFNVAALLFVATLLVVVVRLEAGKRLAAVSSGILIASIVLFLSKASEWSPGWLPFDPVWCLAAMAGATGALLLRSAGEQAVALTVGWLLAEVFRVGAAPTTEQVQLLSMGGSDRWWLSMAIIRSLSMGSIWLSAIWREYGMKGGQRS